ncbi:MAG TPA: Gfo/Idh/MocA family oxidoreductase [Phycisphaerae bacterium]|nr:Gfo/Idh/MocA family oxidoreductase [Phycisphaerae bacterium]HOJ75683.1 Gfo/Idh/MocA family oxidoreductase [Phycisphaerae bacterium]HOM53176.1 Gfo/Idh/MocA family oxidoreductase [Phycisphaerae bacterium]HON66425.1 Gfo/Idh/MocA family oxidoreductase [Phycisphaerae bacterium]HPP28052.1 Gfo/Idh/MocA family oxidoreductase [Phycisphaerae bacterium]
MASKNTTTRRRFLSLSAAGVAAPYMITSGALGSNGRPGANSRINIAIIGTNGQGQYNLNELLKQPDTSIVGICELDPARRNQAIAAVNKAATQPEDAGRHDPKPYTDYREVLARKDVDAVLIATTPHWHCRMAVDAAEAGKDFYLEKPMSLYPAETLAIKRAAEKHQRITQIGTQIHATENYRRIVDVVRSGVLGKISLGRTFHVFNLGRQGIGRATDTKVPEGLDWDMWIGPAPMREFNPLLYKDSAHHPSFMAYSGGWTPGMAPHIVDIPFWALELDYPLYTYSSGGRYLIDDDGDAYDMHEVTWQFPGFTLTWCSSMINSYAYTLQGNQGCHRRRGIYLHGENGTLIGDYGVLQVEREACFLHKFDLKDVPVTTPRSPGHHREWLDGIRSRQQPSCHVGYHAKIDMALTLSLLSLRLGRSIQFDPKTERIVGDDEAARLAIPEYRSPWRFPTEYL